MSIVGIRYTAVMGKCQNYYSHTFHRIIINQLYMISSIGTILWTRTI